MLFFGTSNKDAINTSANLLFSAEFNQTNSNFYKTNRYVTCSSFMEQKDLTDPAYTKLFENLEKALGSDITLCDYPKVTLKPAFHRGSVIELTNKLLFRGLVSNAAGPSENF